MFSSTKTGHMAHIILAALLGQVAGNELAPPNPAAIEQYGHLAIQALVAIVTIWATVRKAFQKPEEVVKVPVASVSVTGGEAAPVADGPVGGEVRDGGAE